VVKRLGSDRGAIFLHRAFTGVSLSIFLVFIAEAIVYFWLRFRIKNKWWVRLHVWPLFIATVLIQSLILVIAKVADNYWGPVEFRELNGYLRNIKFYSFWIVVPLCHIFFIATIVKIFRSKKEVKNDDAPPGLLDEFID
jgi:cbb3-type cytochrome oxidase subunit 3